MHVLEINHVKHYLKDRLLLDINQLTVRQHDRIGLVGKNGSGKTTLLQIVASEIAPDEGTITQHVRVELLPQLKSVNTIKSGGEVTQEYIQQALMSHAGLLLADEPTTNLDLSHIKWVEEKLNEWSGALIIVSHDRAFLDALCTSIWELKEGQLTVYKGNYSDYTSQKNIESKQEQQAFEIYQKEKKQLEEAMRQKEQDAKRATKKPKHLSSSEARIKGTKTYYASKQKKLHKSVKAFETRLDKLDEIKKPIEHSPIKMNLPNLTSFKNRIILRAEKITGKINDRILFYSSDFYIRGGDKLAVIGENGSGKTTLIRRIIEEGSGITLSPSVKVGYFSQNLNILDNDKTVLENVQSTSTQDESLIRTVLARMHFFEEDVYKQVNVLSGGERVKVALSKVFLSEVNLLVLDEPTNFLDVESLEALEDLFKSYEGSLIFVSHDRQFIEQIATCILEIRNQKLDFFAGTYLQYKEYQEKGKSDPHQDNILLLETKISDVLSRLSFEPTEALEIEFKELIEEKRRLKSEE